MVDTPATTAVAVAPATPKKSPKAKKEKKTTGKPRVTKKASHPAVIVMVNQAVTELKERKGSSLRAIKKYIAVTFKVDADKLAPFIRKALKASVASGKIIQVKGTGANGTFKIPAPEKAKKAAAKPKTTKPKEAKPAAVKKSPVSKKVAKPKKTPVKKSPAKPKSPSKVKKTTKVPTKKPKSPKAKTVKKAVKSPKKK